MKNFICYDPVTKEVKEDFYQYVKGVDEVYVRSKSITVHPLAMEWKWGSWGGWSCSTIIGDYCIVNEDGWFANLESHSRNHCWEWEPEQEYQRYENSEYHLKWVCEKHFEDTIKRQLWGLWYDD